MTKKTVFIFGAGASKADGLPTQAELLENYFKEIPSDNFSADLKEYFEVFFDIRDTCANDVKWPSFEEALAMVEIALEKKQAFAPNYDTEKLKKIHDGLIISMGRAIENCEVSDNTFHQKFVNKLFWKGHGKRHYQKGEYSFVSFNYDILLDKALMNLLNDDIYCDYGINFSNNSKEEHPFCKWSPPKKNPVLILKPHGSLNWMLCPSCDDIYILGETKGNIFKTGLLKKIEVCPVDNSTMKFIIEPPSYFKEYKNYYLQTIWKRFHEVVKQADKIIFIGYSMPDADIMIKYTIKRACFGQEKKFIVVNRNTGNELKNRYTRLLGNVNFHEIGFADLCESENYQKIIKA